MFIDAITGSHYTAISALPPEHQTAREKEAILNDPRLHELLGDQKVVEIRKVEKGYVVLTDRGNELSIRVIYIPAGIGPLQFELDFSSEQNR